jgi:hypothetical protein
MSIIGKLQPQLPHKAAQIFDLEDVLVASRYDAQAQINYYVRANLAGQRSTVKILDYEFERDCGSLADNDSATRRRAYVAKRLLLTVTDETAGDGVAGFSPIAEHNAGLDISPSRLEAAIGRMAAEIDALKQQLTALASRKLEN